MTFLLKVLSVGIDFESLHLGNYVVVTMGYELHQTDPHLRSWKHILKLCVPQDEVGFYRVGDEYEFTSNEKGEVTTKLKRAID